MRPVINLLSHFATMRKQATTLLVATTGDTGPAAVRAVGDASNPLLTILVHYPHGQISEFQRWVIRLNPDEQSYSLLPLSTWCVPCLCELLFQEVIDYCRLGMRPNRVVRRRWRWHGLTNKAHTFEQQRLRWSWQKAVILWCQLIQYWSAASTNGPLRKSKVILMTVCYF